MARLGGRGLACASATRDQERPLPCETGVSENRALPCPCKMGVSDYDKRSRTALWVCGWQARVSAEDRGQKIWRQGPYFRTLGPTEAASATRRASSLSVNSAFPARSSHAAAICRYRILTARSAASSANFSHSAARLKQ